MNNQFWEAILKAFELIWERDPEVIAITKLSFTISFQAVLVASFFAIPLGYLISKNEFIGRGLLITISNTFTGFPPVVMGVFLYLLFSRDGPLGFLRLLYTPSAMVIAQLLLSFPIVLSVSIQAFNAVNNKLMETLQTTTFTRLERWLIIFYEIREILVGGIVFAFGRAISEVGAIIIVGGNIRWKTRTLTTAAVLEVNQGRPEVALALGIILLSASIIVNLVFRYFQIDQMSNQRGWRKKRTTELDTPKFKEEVIKQFKELFETPRKTSLVVQEYSKRFNDRVIIEKSNFSIPEGKITLLLGANGSGKTTILRCLAGIDTNYHGTITYSEDVANTPFIHQKPLLFRVKAKHNLFTHSDEEEKRKNLLLELFQLEGLLEEEARKLSGGESRLIAITRTLLPNPGILFLDEVTADLDPLNMSKIERTLIFLREVGYTIVLSSHNIQQAKRLADHLLFIHKKKVIESNNPKEFFMSPPHPEIKDYLEGIIPW